jgi:hypothetical protein
MDRSGRGNANPLASANDPRIPFCPLLAAAGFLNWICVKVL